MSTRKVSRRPAHASNATNASPATKATKALTIVTSSLAEQVPARLKKVRAALVVARKKAAGAVAKNPFAAVAGASVVGFALAKLKRLG